jgi:membrane-associated phospholipid phosphatase
MNFFHYDMPPFPYVMGVFYIIIAAIYLLKLLIWGGYWQNSAKYLKLNLQSLGKIRILSFILLIFFLISFADLPLAHAVKKWDMLIHAYNFWDFICSCAESNFIIGFLFSFMLLASYLNRHRLAEVSRIAIMSSIYAGLVNSVFKFIFNRQRPSIGFDQWHFFAFFENKCRNINDLFYAYNSMPSGHTICTVAAVVPFFMAYSQIKLLRGALISWCILVAFSRVYTLNHWLSDVTLASALGFIVGLSIYQINSQRLTGL